MSEPSAHSHCHFCGTRFGDLRWPRRCAACGRETYRNPLPVAALLVPVDGRGLLAIERRLEPAGLALPGGFIDHGEDWRAAAARELREEAQVSVEPERIRERRVLSAPDGTLLVFGVTEELDFARLPPFVASEEAAARRVITDAAGLVFPLHAQVASEFFASERRS